MGRTQLKLIPEEPSILSKNQNLDWRFFSKRRTNPTLVNTWPQWAEHS
jgi:hypothetical protein